MANCFCVKTRPCGVSQQRREEQKKTRKDLSEQVCAVKNLNIWTRARVW